MQQLAKTHTWMGDSSNLVEYASPFGEKIIILAHSQASIIQEMYSTLTTKDMH
jgi:hypothetical protein